MNTESLKEDKNANEIIAEENRLLFKQKNVFVVNILGCAGSGKTETLVRTIEKLRPDIRIAVIVGDMCTANDAKRLNENGTMTIQVNTDGMNPHCYLASHVVKKAVSSLDMDNIDLLFIENLGDLICPPEYDIGENYKIIILSVSEGEAIPLKNPAVFKHCDAVALSKTDLLPYLDYDTKKVKENLSKVCPDIPVFAISSKTEEGFEDWINFFKDLLKN